MSNLALLLLSILLICLALAVVVGLFLGVVFIVWSLYLLVIPYFFGGFAQNSHSAWHSLVYPHFWPFVGMWILVFILMSVIRGKSPITINIKLK